MIDWILVLLCIGIGVGLGLLIATVVYSKMTPEQLYDRLIWALDKAEGIPALQTAYDKLAAILQQKLEEWIQSKWGK